MLNWLKPSKAVKSLGQLGEELAQDEYKKRGLKIIAANFFNKKGLRLGEIDFIACDKKKIIFVEVKTRTSAANKFGSGAEAVDQFKQIKILKAVKVFLQKNPKYGNLQPQIDVCIVLANGVDPVKSAESGSAKRLFNRVDKGAESVKIISNAVEDWN